MKGDNQQDLAQENLKRISANFELELLRLIRTLNFISQAKELYKDQIDYFQSLTDKYKLGLSDFTIKLLEAERKSHVSAVPIDGENPYAAPTEPAQVSTPLIEVIDELREYLNEIESELERSKTAYIRKLDSVHSLYNLELGASQKELDTKLQRLQKEMTRIMESVPTISQKTEQPSGTPTYDYVKPPRENTEQAKTKFETKNHVPVQDTKPLIDEPSPKRTALIEKQASDSEQASDSQDKDKDKQSKIKSSHVAGVGLIILGIIVGILFYDILLKRWGIHEYTNGDSVNTYTTIEIPSDKTESETEIPADSGKTEITIDDESISAPGEDLESLTVQTEEHESQIVEHDEVPGGGEIDTAPAVLPETPGTDVTTYTVKGPGGNVRNGPGMNYDIVSVVKGGQEFHGTGEKRGRWVQVVTPDGSEGWISGKIITEVK